MTVRFRTFRKHRRPCGQPAAVGEKKASPDCAPQSEHKRYSRTPKIGHSFRDTTSPYGLAVFSTTEASISPRVLSCYETRTNRPPGAGCKGSGVMQGGRFDTGNTVYTSRLLLLQFRLTTCSNSRSDDAEQPR